MERDLIRNLYRKLRYNLILLFRQTKGAHQISLGFVIGFFPCWFPTFGIGPALSIALSRFAKVSIAAAVIAASIGSILWPVLFFLNYKVGTMLTNLFSGDPQKVVKNPISLDEGWPEGYVEPAEQINSWGQAGIDFIVGSSFNSVFLSIVGYFIMRLLISEYRLAILTLVRGPKVWRRRKLRREAQHGKQV